VRKAADVILIALVVVGIGVGAYKIGRAVTRESDAAGEASSGETVGASTATATTATTASKPRRDTRDLQILVAKIVAAALVMLALLATVNALLRSRRLERWER
jgi:hypothetical protein